MAVSVGRLSVEMDLNNKSAIKNMEAFTTSVVYATRALKEMRRVSDGLSAKIAKMPKVPKLPKMPAMPVMPVTPPVSVGSAAMAGGDVGKSLVSKGMLTSLSRAREGINAIGRAASLTSIALGGLAVAAVSAYADLQDTATRAAAITSKGGSDFTRDYAMMERAATDLSLTTRYTAREIAEGYVFMAMAGNNATDSIKSMVEVTKLANISGMGLGKSADIITNILSGYGKKVEELPRVLDVLTATATNSNTSLETLGSTFQNAAPMASSLGVEIEKVAAMAGVLGNAGIKAGKAGTHLMIAMRSLSKDGSPKAKAALDLLGITMEDMTDGPISDMIAKLEGAKAAMGDKLFAGKMAEAFGRATTSMLAMTNQGAEAMQKLEEATGESANGIADKMNKIFDSTLMAEFEKTKSSIIAMAKSFGETLAPAAKNLLTSVKELASGITNLDADKKELIVTIASFAGKASVAVAALAAMAGGVITLGLAVSAMSAIASTAAAPFIAIGAALAAIVGAAAYIAFDSLTDSINYTTGEASNFIDKINGLRDAWDTATASGEGFKLILRKILIGFADLASFGLLSEQFDSIKKVDEINFYKEDKTAIGKKMAEMKQFEYLVNENKKYIEKIKRINKDGAISESHLNEALGIQAGYLARIKMLREDIQKLKVKTPGTREYDASEKENKRKKEYDDKRAKAEEETRKRAAEQEKKIRDEQGKARAKAAKNARNMAAERFKQMKKELEIVNKIAMAGKMGPVVGVAEKYKGDFEKINELAKEGGVGVDDLKSAIGSLKTSAVNQAKEAIKAMVGTGKMAKAAEDAAAIINKAFGLKSGDAGYVTQEQIKPQKEIDDFAIKEYKKGIKGISLGNIDLEKEIYKIRNGVSSISSIVDDHNAAVGESRESFNKLSTATKAFLASESTDSKARSDAAKKLVSAEKELERENSKQKVIAQERAIAELKTIDSTEGLKKATDEMSKSAKFFGVEVLKAAKSITIPYDRLQSDYGPSLNDMLSKGIFNSIGAEGAPNAEQIKGATERVSDSALATVGSALSGDLNGTIVGAGTALGTAAGAAIGSFAPVIGTAIGATVGSAIGSALGSITAGMAEALIPDERIGNAISAALIAGTATVGTAFGGTTAAAAPVAAVLSLSTETESFKNMIGGMQIVVDDFIKGLEPIWKDVAPVLITAFKHLLDALAPVAEMLINTGVVGDIMKAVVSVIGNIIFEVVKYGAIFINFVKFVSDISGVIGFVAKSIWGVAVTIGKAVGEFIEMVAEIPIVSSALSGLADLFSDVATFVMDVFNGIGAGVEAIFNGIKEALKKIGINFGQVIDVDEIELNQDKFNKGLKNNEDEIGKEALARMESTEALNNAASELNAPTGFRASLERFRALSNGAAEIGPRSWSNNSSGWKNQQATLAKDDKYKYVQHINIYVDDEEAAFRKYDMIVEKKRIDTTGVSAGGAAINGGFG